MFHSRLSRLLAVGALSGTAAFATVAFPGSASPATQIVCKTLTGNIATTVTLSGCTSAATGGSSKPLPATSLASGGTITWVNSKTTTVTLKVSTTEHDGTETQTCPAGTSEYEAKGKVTADTTGFAPVGGVAKAEACVNGTTGAISLEPGSKAIFK
jgi:hypothetical protein